MVKNLEKIINVERGKNDIFHNTMTIFQYPQNHYAKGKLRSNTNDF